MKQASFFLAALVFILASALAEPVAKTPAFRAGAAAVDVTPREFPLNMPGGFSANLAESAHDPLHARALVLDDGMTTLAMVVVDSLAVAPETCADAKKLAAERCGIQPGKILISGTHSHSAPNSNSTSGPAPAVAYRKLLVEGIAEAIVRAHGALQPAAFGVATQPLPEEVFNRRWFLKPGKMPLNPYGKMDQVKMNPPAGPDVLDHPAGPTDPDITVLSLQTLKRKPLALMANYSLHYVGGIPKAQVSADYYGEFARLMPSRVNGDANFVAMMSNGTSGDINNIPFNVTRPPREPFEQVRIVAQKAADASWLALRKIEKYDASPRLGMVQREVVLKYRQPTSEQVAEAKAVLAIKDKTELEKLPRLADSYARSTVAAAERKEETVAVIVQAIRIGEFAVCALPFEVFCEIGLDLKQRSPFPRTMVVSIANGRGGYLPTPEQHKLGGYETWLGTNNVQEDASVILTNNLLEMLAELKKEA